MHKADAGLVALRSLEGERRSQGGWRLRADNSPGHSLAAEILNVIRGRRTAALTERGSCPGAVGGAPESRPEATAP